MPRRVQHPKIIEPTLTYVSPNFCTAAPTPFRSVSFISEYLREMITPSAPPWNAATTASSTPDGVHLLWFLAVGMSTSMPDQSRVLVPWRPARERGVSRRTESDEKPVKGIAARDFS